MATYGLNPDGLLGSGEELRGVTRSIDNALDELNAVVNRFITMNLGGAAESYRAAQTVWEGGMTTMNNSLGSGAVAIDRIRETYQVADAQGAALFQGNL
ncbi:MULTISPECIES: WXG100 family type VII secretion target [unclassified Micromonospora]|uniref:WXG100 family type VII secretion target n=1 Tax=unclassified Micromonospora TaxID=2617518 RepID=UPI0010334278|nr:MULTISPECIES: WXG100 family type VII secretion target [unclassified Micromonospora]QKW13586.1 WXG100 family type VII secretion target [Verrucosispora sp. NA02020]TBL34422.1 hypothetical protein EYA84_15555 [Verrucosispora sp. SN26_14.1]